MSKKEETLPPNLPKKALGIRLLNCVRDKKYKEAASLLEHDPDMTVKDAAGWQALHFAALEGNVEMIELLLKSGAVVECWDNNGQSPLHKAARRGHLEAVVSLVNHGAAFPLDWKGQTPLQLSVIEKHVDIVQILCSFGAYVPPEDWNFMTEDKSAKMKQIKEILKTQRSILTDFEYRKIIWKTLKIEKEQTEIEELELTVNSKDLVKPFYLYIAKKTEFTEFINYVNVLREEHELFSDLFECHVWRTAERILELKIKIDGVPGILHDLVIVSQEPGAARIANFNIDNQQTTVTVAVTIRPMKKVTFAVLLKEKQPEIFQVSRSSTVITPVAEPESEISIPDGTFEEPVELLVEFVETKCVNEEEVDGPILLTNVLDVTLSEGSTMTSGKELTMKLPVHEKDEGKEDNIVVLVTSEEYPECSDDWEVIEAKSSGKDGSIVFSVNHLSIFVGAPKDKVLKNKVEVVDAIERSRGNMCKATFIGFSKLEDENVLTIVVECATPKRADKREKKWKKKGFKELFTKSDQFLISNTEIFRLDFQLCPNLKDPTDSSNSLQFQRKKENYLVKELHVIDNTAEIHGEMKVDLEKRTEVELIEAGCFKKKNNPIKTKTKITYNHLTDMKFDFSKAYIRKLKAERATNNSNKTSGVLDIPKEDTEQNKAEDIKAGTSKSPTEESTADTSSNNDRQSNQNESEDNISHAQKQEFDADTNTIPALRWSSLKELASALSEEEAEHIAIQLDLKRSDVEELQNTLNKQYGMAFLVFKHWRDSTQSVMRVKKLQEALIAIGREDLGIAFKQAHMDDVPFRKEDVGAKKRFRLA